MSKVSDDTVITGTGVVPGVRYAEAVWIRPRPALPTSGPVVEAGEREAEYERFTTAADTVAERLSSRSEAADGAAKEVLNATAGMVRDRGWRKAVNKNIKSGHPAEYAVVAATTKFISMFEAAGGVMAERVTDLRDIRDRVIAELRGEEEPGLPQVNGEVVLFADDLSPADTAALDTNHFVALVTELGGPTSHTAIIARQLNVPCIVAVGSNLNDIKAGDKVLLTARWAPSLSTPTRRSLLLRLPNQSFSPSALHNGAARQKLKMVTAFSFSPTFKMAMQHALHLIHRPRELACSARRCASFRR